MSWSLLLPYRTYRFFWYIPGLLLLICSVLLVHPRVPVRSLHASILLFVPAVATPRFRASEGDLGGGSHSISHNAIVACLRLDQHEIALDLLMDKVK